MYTVLIAMISEKRITELSIVDFNTILWAMIESYV